MSGRFPLAINAATLYTTPFPDELKYYRASGFRRVEVWLDKITTWMTATKRSLADAKAELQTHELQVIGACPLSVDLNEGQAAWERRKRDLVRRLDFASGLGAPTIVCTVPGKRGEWREDAAVLTLRLRWLADEAAARRMTVGLEFIPRVSAVGCLSTAVRLIREVDRPSFGLLLDLFHFYLSESRLDDLAALPHKKLFMVHVDDALDLPIEWLTHDSRTFPGKGSLRATKLMSEIRTCTGFHGPWSIELWSDWIWKLPPKTIARRLRPFLKQCGECPP